jgi:hypothetical protein
MLKNLILQKKPKNDIINDSVMYPFNAYGWTVTPKQEDLLIKNATIWTNEKEGCCKTLMYYLRMEKYLE